MSEFLDHPESQELPFKVRFRMDSVKAVIAGLTKQVVHEPKPISDLGHEERVQIVFVPQPPEGVGYTDKDAYVAPVSQERHASPNFYL